jgi:type I restriction enzyme S subunit
MSRGAGKAGWQIRSLDQIGITQAGSTPKTAEKDNFGDFVPFIKPSDFNPDGSVEYTNAGLSEMGLRKARRIPESSVLMVCIGATIGKCGYCDRVVTTNQQINSLTPFDGLLHKFVFYQMLTGSFQRRVLLSSGQATLPIINKSKWSALTLTFPPLPEQRRIVAILDEAFDGIATAKANAEKNLQNGRALFESHLQAVFAQSGPDWGKRQSLGDIFHIGSSKRVYAEDWTFSGVPFYGGKEIVKLSRGETGVVSQAYISEKQYGDLASLYDMPRKGDILMTARGTIGVGYVVQEGDKFYYKDGNIISFRQKVPTNPYFVLFAFRALRRNS